MAAQEEMLGFFVFAFFLCFPPKINHADVIARRPREGGARGWREARSPRARRSIPELEEVFVVEHAQISLRHPTVLTKSAPDRALVTRMLWHLVCVRGIAESILTTLF